MCGIAGIVDHAGRFSRAELEAIAVGMSDTLVHRGPDQHGVWVSPDGMCALAHRRLSILDLSERGRQPMTTDDGQVGLTYNGEVYSFPALRRDLEARGYPFRSDSDAEVLLYLFASGEPANLSGVEGMYAFATWNASRRRLFLARDAYGQKPLYVCRGEGFVAFASEMQAFRAIPGFEARVSRQALAEYLLLQYVHAPRALWERCSKLEPGSWLAIDFDGRTPREHAGRHFEFRAEGGHATRSPYEGISQAELEAKADELRPLLIAAVEKRLASDVPLGAFLSGGVDSGLIVAMMTKELGLDVDTFSIGFEDTDESEHLAAREAARLLGTRHHEKMLDPDAIELLPRIAAALDEPLGDSSCLPTFLISEFIREHVTVALSGDGGDELFGGYGRYRETLREEADWRMRALWLVRHRRAWRPGQAYCSLRWLMFDPQGVRDLAGAAAGDHADALVGGWMRELDRRERPLVHRMRELDVRTYMPGAVLAKVDRMSMRFALEVRSPFYDRGLAAFSRDLEAEYCYSDGVTKPLLRTLAARYLPKEHAARPKMGFGLPGKAWTKDAILGLCDEALLARDGHVAAMLGHDGLRRFVAHQRQDGCFSIFQVWTVLVLEFWLREHAAVPAVEVA